MQMQIICQPFKLDSWIFLCLLSSKINAPLINFNPIGPLEAKFVKLVILFWGFTAQSAIVTDFFLSSLGLHNFHQKDKEKILNMGDKESLDWCG